MTAPPGPEQEVWRYRRLLTTLVVRDLRTRFAGSSLGVAWAFAQPLVTLGLYVLVFSTIIQGGRFSISGTTAGYAAYLLPGLLAWQWVSESLAQSCGSVVGQGGLLRKVAFPATLLPLTQLLASAIPFVAVLSLFCIVGVAVGWFKPLSIVLLPGMVLLNGALLIGPVLLLSSITVFVRDLAQAMPSLLQALFWATPIVYTAEMVTGRYPAMSGFFLVNPAYHLVSAYREILLLGQVPSAGSLIYLCVLAAISYGVGRWVFQRLRPVFADES